jgi:hypothetical protein
MMNHASLSRSARFGIAAIALLLGASLASAAPLSGGASGGGAIQGGSGAPGSGVGIPGSIVNNTTAEGIGEDDTPPIYHQAFVSHTDQPEARAYYPLQARSAAIAKHHRRQKQAD